MSGSVMLQHYFGRFQGPGQSTARKSFPLWAETAETTGKTPPISRSEFLTGGRRMDPAISQPY